MSIEHRPDGALRFNAHVPLWTSLLVMVLFFVFGILFAYGLVFEDTGEVEYRGVALGIAFQPWMWKVLFLFGTLAMLGPGVFILLGLMRGGKPHVRIEANTITVAGRPMAKDVALRWDDIVSVRRFRIQHHPAIAIKSRSGKTLQLTSHIFPEKGEFETLCREIEARADVLGAIAR